jgi:hypothetical protein
MGLVSHFWQMALSQIHAAVLLLASLPALFASVDTGADIPHDWFGGALTECAPSNIPAGGSPANLNVEFLPGMVRTRGGLQPQQGAGSPSPYASIAAGPWQVRWVDDYATAPESPVQMALLTNPTLNLSAIAIGGTIIGNIYGYGNRQIWSPGGGNSTTWTGPLAKASTQFGRKYIAISEGRYGYDVPRQWDGTNYDRVSQCGPGAPPTVADGAYPAGIALNVFAPISATIVNITNSGGLCTATVLLNLFGIGNGSAGVLPAFLPGDQALIEGNTVSGYNGTPVTLLSVNPGTLQVTFASPGGSGTGTGGTMYFQQTLVTCGAATPAQQAQLGLGAAAQISGTSVAAYNGQAVTVRLAAAPLYTNAAYPQTLSIVVMLPASLLNKGNATGGTISPPSHITQGLRQCSVCWITRQGYISKPSPPFNWNTAGNLLANLTNIPTGPSNVVARLLLFTPYLTPPATTGTFYSIRQATLVSGTMQINDNTTTSLTGLDFSDSDLAAGFNAQYLFGLVELGECAGSFPYAGRMFWWGELNTNQEFVNLSFNGGWNLLGGYGGNDLPLGWTSPSGSVGSGKRLANGGVWLDAYQINGSNATGNAGTIQQAAYQNYLLNSILTPNTSFSVRVTAKATIAAAQLVVGLFSASAGLALTATMSNWTAAFSTQIAGLGTLPATIPSDLVLQIYAPTSILGLDLGQSITVDRIQPFPTLQPINYTVVRASYASDPESFDGVTGLIQPVYSNGQAVRSVYQLRDSMYITTDRGTFVIKDTGGEPAAWTLDPVSNAVGSVGPNAVAAGEDWEVKVNRYGLYIYIGREPEKISQEIQSLWYKNGVQAAINWAAGYKIWTAVDLQNKRVYVGAPVGSAIECNTLFVMDYNFLDTSDMIASLPTLRFSTYTGRPLVMPQGRKWTQWTFALPGGGLMPVPCGAFVEQPGGIAQFLLGGAVDNNVYFIDPTNRGNDNGVATTSYYTTHFFPTSDEEQQLQLRSHMHGFSFGRFYAQGDGKMSVTTYHNSLDDPDPKQESVDLKNPALIDSEETFDDFTAERYALQWMTNTLGSWFQVERVTRVVEQGPDLTRGSNLQ